MSSTLVTAGRWLRRRAEDVAVLLLLVMFLAFIVQIVFRYVFNWPHNWSYELSVLCWVWGVLWGAAFVTTEKDEIRFDVVYGLLGADMRRRLTIVTGVALVAIYGMSLPAVTDYVLFMRVERTASLRIPFDVAFFVYVIFAAATVLRYLWLIWNAIRGEAPKTLLDSTEAGSAP
jgi:TRAP-type C4-dicarboxylate transport system permease small subunit